MSARAGGSVRSTCGEPLQGLAEKTAEDEGGRERYALVSLSSCDPESSYNIACTTTHPPTHAVRRMTTCYVHPPDTPRDW